MSNRLFVCHSHPYNFFKGPFAWFYTWYTVTCDCVELVSFGRKGSISFNTARVDCWAIPLFFIWVSLYPLLLSSYINNFSLFLFWTHLPQTSYFSIQKFPLIFHISDYIFNREYHQIAISFLVCTPTNCKTLPSHQQILFEACLITIWVKHYNFHNTTHGQKPALRMPY